MRVLLGPGALVLTLGIALLIGCNASSDSPTKAPPSQPQPRRDQEKAVKSEKSAAPFETATPREYVLTVEGMT